VQRFSELPWTGMALGLILPGGVKGACYNRPPLPRHSVTVAQNPSHGPLTRTRGQALTAQTPSP